MASRQRRFGSAADGRDLGVGHTDWPPERFPAADYIGVPRDAVPTRMADLLLAQSAVDPLVSTAHELIIEGPSYRQRQKPTVNGRPADMPVDDQKGHQP